MRRRPAGLQDRATPRSRTTSSTPRSPGRSGSASTASASTPSSTSPTSSGRSTGSGRATSSATGFFLLGEVWGGDPQVLDPWFAGDEMDAGFDFALPGQRPGVRPGARPDGRLRPLPEVAREGPRRLPPLALPLVARRPGRRSSSSAANVELFRLAALLQMTSAGIPTIYYGEEVGRAGGDWPDNRSDMPWGERDVLPGAGAPPGRGARGPTTRARSRSAAPTPRSGAGRTTGSVTDGRPARLPAATRSRRRRRRRRQPRRRARHRHASPPPRSGAARAPEDLLGGPSPLARLGGRRRAHPSAPARRAILAPGVA